MQEPAVVSKPREVVEDLPTVLAFVNLVAPVGMDVGTEIVPTGIATPTNVAGKGLLASMDPHVASEVSGTDKLPPTYFTRVWSLRLHP